MPGGRARRNDPPARWLDLSHHLVIGAWPQGAREQRRAARPGLGASSRADRRDARARAILMPKGRRLFLDAAGVLADFDEGPRQLLGMPIRKYEAKHGRNSFWTRL